MCICEGNKEQGISENLWTLYHVLLPVIMCYTQLCNRWEVLNSTGYCSGFQVDLFLENFCLGQSTMTWRPIRFLEVKVHTVWTLALGGGVWLLSHSGERAPNIHWIEGWVGPSVCLNVTVKRIPVPTRSPTLVYIKEVRNKGFLNQLKTHKLYIMAVLPFLMCCWELCKR